MVELGYNSLSKSKEDLRLVTYLCGRTSSVSKALVSNAAGHRLNSRSQTNTQVLKNNNRGMKVLHLPCQQLDLQVA